MRKTVGLLVTVTWLGGSAGVEAQVGITGGWSYSWASITADGSDVPTTEHSGFQAGLMYGGGDFIGYLIEALYTQKGFSVTDGGETTETKTAYIEVPLMLALRLPVARVVGGPRVYGGANVGFEVSCSVEGSAPTLAPVFSCGSAKAFDFGWKAGLGFQILFIGVDVAYTAGFTNISDLEAVSIKNRALTITGVLGLP